MKKDSKNENFGNSKSPKRNPKGKKFGLTVKVPDTNSEYDVYF
jgi:hypothetical protein